MPASEIGSMAPLGAGGLYYDLSSSSNSASASPQNNNGGGFYTDAADLRPPGAGGAFDLSAGMEFGGYGVPMADKETMLRHFAPVLLQDGQIGVDQDTMMMWSTMPSTYETQDWVTYMSSMLDLAHANVDPAAGMNSGGIVGPL